MSVILQRLITAVILTIFAAQPGLCDWQNTPPPVDVTTVTDAIAGVENSPAASNGSQKEDDFNAVLKLRSEIGDTAHTDPQKAIAQYESFIAARPNLSSPAGVLAAEEEAKIWYYNLHNATQAIAVCDKYSKQFGSDNSNIDLLWLKGSILNAGGHYAETEDAMKPRLLDIAAAQYSAGIPALDEYDRALRSQQKYSDEAAMLITVLQYNPVLMDIGKPGGDSTYDNLVSALLATKRPQDALSWAKLRFEQCGTDKSEIAGAVKCLTVASYGVDPSGKFIQSFIGAIKNPDAPNPLRDVALPAIDAAAVMAKVPGGNIHAYINALIATGHAHDAMIAANNIKPGPNSIQALEIVRVFKASDLNFSRLNAYIEYASNGSGANPVAAYLAAAPAPAPGASK